MGELAGEPTQWPTATVLARLYDWEHDGFTADTELYVSLAERTGGRVLEPACGSGRVLEPLARRRLEVVGFDSSPEMLARASRRLGGLEPPATLHQADLADPLPPGPFRLVVFALDAFGLLGTPGAQLELLGRVREAMSENGLLVLDLVHAAPLADQPQGVSVLQRSATDDEIRARVTKWMVRRLLPATQELALDCFYDLAWPDGSLGRIEQSLRLRYFSPYELELLLDRSGLGIQGIYGDYDLEPFQDESERIIVLAGKQA